MQTTNEHETELVLGTKQLLGLLFLSFVLLGVFFAMGYVLGRNSAPSEARRVTEPLPATSAPVQSERPSAAVGEVPTSTQAAPTPEPPASSEAQPTTPAVAASPAAATPAPAATSREPKSGELYVQLTAVARPDADMLADVLSKRGFRTVVTPASKEGLFRVMVGPAATEAELGKLRTDLEQIGFKGIPRKIP